MQSVRFGIGVGEAWARGARAVSGYLVARGIDCALVDDRLPHELEGAVVAGQTLECLADADAYELLAAPVALGARYKSRAIAFHDVVVRRDRPWISLVDAQQARVGWNDRDPLLWPHRSFVTRVTGGVTEPLGALNEDEALGAVATGACDLAVVDSLAVEHWRRSSPTLASSLRVLQSLGPQAGPAWIVHRSVPLPMRRRLRSALLEMHRHPAGWRALADAALSRFVGVHPALNGPMRFQSGFREAAGGAAGSGAA
jgi:hypothetical protein